MNPSVCICCGEPIREPGNILSRNPNICASCSSLVDGMEEANLAPLPLVAPEETGPGECRRARLGNMYASPGRMKRVASPSPKPA